MLLRRKMQRLLRVGLVIGVITSILLLIFLERNGNNLPSVGIEVLRRYVDLGGWGATGESATGADDKEEDQEFKRSPFRHHGDGKEEKSLEEKEALQRAMAAEKEKRKLAKLAAANQKAEESMKDERLAYDRIKAEEIKKFEEKHKMKVAEEKRRAEAEADRKRKTVEENLARIKAEENRKADEAATRIEAEKIRKAEEKEKIREAEEKRKADSKAEQKRKAEQEKHARIKAEAESKAAKETSARIQVEEQRKAESTARIRAEEKQKEEAQLLREQQAAAEKAKEELRAQQEAAEKEQEHRAQQAAAEKAAQERRAQQAAAEKAEEERRAQQAAAEKVAQERRAQQAAAEKAAQERRAQQAAAEKAEEERRAQQAAAEKVAQERRAQQAKVAQQQREAQKRQQEEWKQEQLERMKKIKDINEQKRADDEQRAAEFQGAETDIETYRAQGGAVPATPAATAPSTVPDVSIAVVACGDRLEETIVLLKSARLLSRANLHFHVFAEDDLKPEFHRQLGSWPEEIKKKTTYTIRSLTFPKENEEDWKKLFKPCASQRLFLPSLLPKSDAVLYLDTDILLLRPPEDIWRFFNRFNSTQIAALSPEHEDASIGWYNRFARHPFYPPLGVNSGVMLMNLTRMRQVKWIKTITPYYKEYKYRITWGDQDLINIFFHFYPEMLYVYPCHWNFRPDHCMYMSICKQANEKGVNILHGNRRVWFNEKQPAFKAFYQAFQEHNFSDHLQEDLLSRLRRKLMAADSQNTNCGKNHATMTRQLERQVKLFYQEEEKIAAAARAMKVEKPKSGDQTVQVEKPRSGDHTAKVEKPKSKDQTAKVEKPKSEDQTGQVEKPKSGDQTAQVEEPKSADQTAQVEKPKSGDQTAQVEKPKSGDQTAKVINKQEAMGDQIDNLEGKQPGSMGADRPSSVDNTLEKIPGQGKYSTASAEVEARGKQKPKENVIGQDGKQTEATKATDKQGPLGGPNSNTGKDHSGR